MDLRDDPVPRSILLRLGQNRVDHVRNARHLGIVLLQILHVMPPWDHPRQSGVSAHARRRDATGSIASRGLRPWKYHPREMNGRPWSALWMNRPSLWMGPEEMVFQSSNAWDAAGASAFGFRVAWINRFGQHAERLPGRPDIEIGDLMALPRLLG